MPIRTVTIATGMVMTEVATIPTVMHAEVSTSYRTEVVATAVIPAMSTHTVPGMCSTVAGIEYRTSEVEVVTMRIAGVNTEVPVAVTPIEWTIEVGGSDKCLPLCIQQHIAEVAVAALPVGAIDIIVTRHTHQVVEVDLIGSLILLISQIQFVGHLVSQEQSLVASLFVTHRLARCCYREHSYEGYHHLFHICIF